MLYDFFHVNRTKSRTYFGYDIYKSGGWWWCEFGTSTEQWLQADTLEGIKLALRRKLKALWPDNYGHLKTESPFWY